MTRARALPLLAIGAVGLGIRLFLAFHWFGNGDLLTFEIVGQRTLDDPLHSYAGNVGPGAVLFPYPPGYLPWLMAADKLAEALDRPFADIVQLLPIAADLLDGLHERAKRIQHRLGSGCAERGDAEEKGEFRGRSAPEPEREREKDGGSGT